MRKSSMNIPPVEVEIVINVSQMMGACKTEKEREKVLQWVSVFSTMQHAAFKEREKAWHSRAESEMERIGAMTTPAMAASGIDRVL